MSMGMRQYFLGLMVILTERRKKHADRCAKGISEIDEYRKTVGRIAGLDEAILTMSEYHKKHGEPDDE
jgi:hypothetical protein